MNVYVRAVDFCFNFDVVTLFQCFDTTLQVVICCTSFYHIHNFFFVFEYEL